MSPVASPEVQSSSAVNESHFLNSADARQLNDLSSNGYRESGELEPDEACDGDVQMVSNDRVSWLTRACSKLILNRLKQLKSGQLVIQLGCDQAVFGQLDEGQVPAIIQVHSETFFKRLVFGGGVAAAESYMDAEWSSPDPVSYTHLTLPTILLV